MRGIYDKMYTSHIVTHNSYNTWFLEEESFHFPDWQQRKAGGSKRLLLHKL